MLVRFDQVTATYRERESRHHVIGCEISRS